jgi:hypothetical protein
MLISGQMQKHTFSISFTIYGDDGGDWKITVSGPGLIPLERETRGSPYFMLDAMLSAAFKASCDRFPERAPLPKPAHVAATKSKARPRNEARR